MKSSCVGCRFFSTFLDEDDNGEVVEVYYCEYHEKEFDKYPEHETCECWEG